MSRIYRAWFLYEYREVEFYHHRRLFFVRPLEARHEFYASPAFHRPLLKPVIPSFILPPFHTFPTRLSIPLALLLFYLGLARRPAIFMPARSRFNAAPALARRRLSRSPAASGRRESESGRRRCGIVKKSSEKKKCRGGFATCCCDAGEGKRERDAGHGTR